MQFGSNKLSCCRMLPLEPSVLLLADLYYQRLSLCGCKGPLSEEALMELFPQLQANISTGTSKVGCFVVCSPSLSFASECVASGYQSFLIRKCCSGVVSL